MRTIHEIRRENAKLLFAQLGGVSKVAKELGYASASLLSQKFGPNPTRPADEKTARRIEQIAGVPAGFMDQDRGSASEEITAVIAAPRPVSPPAAPTAGRSMVQHAMEVLDATLAREGVVLPGNKYGLVLSSVLAEENIDSMDEKIRLLVRLMK